MSTILKALRRLEQEKSVRGDRPLGEAVTSGAPVPASRASASRRWPIFAGVAIGLIALGGAAFAVRYWAFGGDESAAVEVAASSERSEAAAAPAPAPARRRTAAARPNAQAANRRQGQARNPGAAPAAVAERQTELDIPEVAVVKRPPSRRAAPKGSSATPPAGDSAARPQWSGVKLPPAAPVTPSSGEAPVIDLSQLEALQQAAKSAGKSPETIESTRVAPTPSTPPRPTESAASVPTPATRSEAAAVEVAAARTAPESLPTPARSVAPKAAPAPKAEPVAEAEPEAAPVRSVARKSPPRPTAPPQPEVYVSRTVWHPDASRRIAYVELEGRGEIVELREGERIGPLVVTKIAPTGVSFDNRGSEFSRRVGAR